MFYTKSTVYRSLNFMSVCIEIPYNMTNRNAFSENMIYIIILKIVIENLKLISHRS